MYIMSSAARSSRLGWRSDAVVWTMPTCAMLDCHTSKWKAHRCTSMRREGGRTAGPGRRRCVCSTQVPGGMSSGAAHYKGPRDVTVRRRRVRAQAPPRWDCALELLKKCLGTLFYKKIKEALRCAAVWVWVSGLGGKGKSIILLIGQEDGFR